MSYSKPEVVQLTNPISAIQSSGNKPGPNTADTGCYENQTPSAYEADE